MSKIAILATLGLISLAAVASAQAADPAPADQVAASFERIFTEEKHLPTPPSPTATNDDPLYQAFAAIQPNPHSVAGTALSASGHPVKQN